MFKPNEIEAFSMLLDKPMKSLEMRIMEDIVRRIKINGEIIRSADWQITRLLQLGMSMKEIENYIQTALDFSDEDMHKMYSDIIGSGYARDKRLYEAVGAKFIPFEQNHEMQQLISAVASQTNSTLKNITRSLGFAVRQPDGKLQFIKLADYYQKTLDNAMLDISSGAFDYNTVLKRTEKEMTNSGLRTVSYASGWSNRADVAARRAVMTGMAQITAKINEDNAESLGTDMFEVTWHSGARPEHQVWQGKWYTRKELETVCGLGTVTGLCGANCYHDYYPVVPGISEPTYTVEELAELNAKDNTPIEYNGKKYTKYEALQRQRRLETTMRAQRQEIKLLKDGGASEDDLINARARYRGTSHEYAKFSQAMGLPQQRERVTVDGLGNIGQGKYTGGSGKESPVQVPPVGAKVTDKVTDHERLDLLKNQEKSVDISGKSGIIESGEVKELEQAKKRDHKIYITDTAIGKVGKVKLTDFTDEQADDMQTKHKELLKLAKQKNDSDEVLFIDDLNFKSEVQILGDEFSVSPGKNPFAVSIIMNAKRQSLIYLHNHPSVNNFSIADIDTFICEGAIKVMTVVTNQGEVYALNKTSKYDYNKARHIMAETLNLFTGSDIDNREFVKEFLKKCDKGGIEYAKSR